MRTNDVDYPMQPRNLFSAIAGAEQVVLIPDQPTLSVKKDLLRLLKGRKVLWDTPCKFCLGKGRIRFPRKPIKYGKDEICLDCAKSQLAREIQSSDHRIPRSTKDMMARILERTRDYDMALSAVFSEYDPRTDSKLSLYDVIEKRVTKPITMDLDQVIGFYDQPEQAKPLMMKLRDLGIERLLPVQVSAVKEGLLRGKSLLIVSSTSSGKTLLAEMAGIPRALSGSKFLYLTPLVALANLRYSEFAHKYRDLGLETAIKVGVGRIKTGNEFSLNTDFSTADVLVGTYEGVEQLLRSGRARELGDVGVVTIDEIQNLSDPDRGSRLDGMIKKMRVLWPQAQFLFLSATVGNPTELAAKLGASLVLHDERPVPLERHLIPIISPGQKLRLMRRLIRSEFASVSREGYRGQTLVFTNSRKKCHEISSILSSPSAPVHAYHSGLSYERRRDLESQFLEQKIAAVVTTAALAAGVDLPASQVIFETLAMGMEWITPTEFHQMLGRAGRLGFHGSGKAMLLVEPGRSFSRAEKRTEDQVALDLLSSKEEVVRPDYTAEDLTEQVLADVSTFGVLSKDEIEALQEYSVGFSSEVNPHLRRLLSSGMIRKTDQGMAITPTGRVVSSFFLSPEQSALMIRSVKKGADPLKTLVEATTFHRAYVSDRLQNEVERSYRRRISIRFFDSEILDLLSRPRRRVSPWLREMIGRIHRDLLNCRCRAKPYCDCPPRKLSEIMVRQRISGSSPDEISSLMVRDYGIQAYPGDLLEYLNDVARLSEALARLSEIRNKERLAEAYHHIFAQIVG